MKASVDLRSRSTGPIALVQSAAIAFVLVLVVFLLEGRRGINLMDEGFLWYGTWRTAASEIPIRDFVAYDPGRYYWGAAWSQLLGTGLVALRISNAVFQFVGLAIGLLALRQVIYRTWILVMSGLFLTLWMYPRHKLFESSIAMATVAFASWLILQPTAGRFFASGVFLGLSAFVGRNLALYGFLAFCAVFLFLRLRENPPRMIFKVGAWACGIAVGFLPMAFLLIGVRGFRERYAELLLGTLRSGTTNLTVPVPWPWSLKLGELQGAWGVSVIATSLMFVLIPLFVISLLAVLFTLRNFRPPAVLIAATIVGSLYLHHAFARADLPHLAQGIHGSLMALIALPFSLKPGRARVAAFVMAGMVTILSVLSVGITRGMAWQQNGTPTIVRGDALWIDPATKRLLDGVNGMVAGLSGPGESFLAAPYWPGLYACTGRVSPWWNISAVSRETDERQREMVSRLIEKRIQLAIIRDEPLDGREDRRFRNTHRIVWEFLRSDFEVAADFGSGFVLWRRRASGSAASPP